MTSVGQKARTISWLHINGTQVLVRNRLNFMKACTLCIFYRDEDLRLQWTWILGISLYTRQWVSFACSQVFLSLAQGSRQSLSGMESIHPFMKNRTVPIVSELESVNLHFQMSWNDQHFNKTRMSEQQNCIWVNSCFVNFSLLAQIYRSCFAESFDSQSKDNCWGVSCQMTELGWSLNSFAEAVVVLSSSIHTVLLLWLVRQITGIGLDHVAFCFSGQFHLVRVSDL